ncbi:LLM class flavin-dependent oxidoreductase [Halalkalicoccus ordinarius]|uniref:LLM class flavin-dependent oxidoreductase n=1 Tax=Halalkalicoccus ordinarius TaxID=3116651 RepID=UPI00300F5330
MQLGVGLPSFASRTHAIPPDRFRRYARLAEEYRFAGAWVIEHMVKPPSYATSLLDPLTTLSVVAGETKTLPVGTSVMLLPLRNPVLVAKRAATLQHLSGRQLTLGMGTGYVEAEFNAVGVPMAERSSRYREGIELIRRLFDENRVTFDGEFFSVENLQLEPNLGQPPRILAGGGGVDTAEGRQVLDSVKKRLLHADGWIAAPRSPEILKADWSHFASYLESKEIDPDAMDKVALQYLHLVPSEDPEKVRRTQQNVYDRVIGADRSVDHATANWLTGTVDEVKETLEAYESQGFDEVILHPMSTNPAELDRQLQLYQQFLLPEYP